MKVWQHIAISAVSAAVSISLLAVMVFVVPSRKEKVCHEIHIKVCDFDKYRFVSAHTVELHLKMSGHYPAGRKSSEIDLSEIERRIDELNVVKTASCYFDNNGDLQIEITQRMPLYRVKSVKNDYYVDSDRKIMSTSVHFSAYVPLVTGNVDDKFAVSELYDFMEYLTKSSRWGSAFSQVYVYPDNSVELIPRIGNFTIEMGKLDRYREKLDKLDIFLEKMPLYKSWNEYSAISLKYRDQVVCTRRDG